MSWEKQKEEDKLVREYLKRGGRYVAGPFEGFNRKQRRVLERLERVKRREAKRSYQARQRAEAVEARLEELRGSAAPAVEKQNLVQRAFGAVRGIFGRGRQKK